MAKSIRLEIDHDLRLMDLFLTTSAVKSHFEAKFTSRSFEDWSEICERTDSRVTAEFNANQILVVCGSQLKCFFGSIDTSTSVDRHQVADFDSREVCLRLLYNLVDRLNVVSFRAVAQPFRGRSQFKIACVLIVVIFDDLLCYSFQSI